MSPEWALAGATVLGALLLVACTSGTTAVRAGLLSAVHAQADTTILTAPTAPPARVCGTKALLDGPATPPKNAVQVPAGDDSFITFYLQPDTVYWFAPGVHTLGSGEYDNIGPADGDTFIGAPGAILDGQHENHSAFDDTATHVTIEYLTIRNFGTWGDDNGQGVVNHDSGVNWTITHTTIIGNAGAGVMLGSHDVLTWNCLQNNQQYGFSAYSGTGQVNSLTLDHNEIAGNDTYDYEARQPGCGCSGGGKFWNVINAKVTNNWVHNNKSAALWADTDNAGFVFAGNYITNNQGVGIEYEISYNAVIEYNTFVRDGVAGGPANEVSLRARSTSPSRVPTTALTRLISSPRC